MQRKVFDSSVSAILDNLSKLNDDFAQDTVFPDTSSLAKTLQSLEVKLTTCVFSSLMVIMISFIMPILIQNLKKLFMAK